MTRREANRFKKSDGNPPLFSFILLPAYFQAVARSSRARFTDSSQIREDLEEIKGSKLLLGRDRWRNVDPSTRKTICESVCQWIGDRKHALIPTAIDRLRYSETMVSAPQELQRNVWIAGMTHVALQLQKLHQKEPNNKGRTVLLIDDNKQFTDHLTEVLWSLKRLAAP